MDEKTFDINNLDFGSIGDLLMNMIGKENPEVANNINDYRTDPSKALKQEAEGMNSYAGGAKGALEGASGGLLGMAAGFVKGAISSGNNKMNLEDQANQAHEDWSQFWGGRSVQESSSRSYASGGKIKGAGTGKSDSIGMSAPDGSFIVPTENASQAMAYGSDYLGWDDGEVAKRNYGNVDINVSNGEVYYTKDEAETLSNYGVDVDGLAPDAEKNNTGFSRGGRMKKGYKNGSTVVSDLKTQNDEALERDVNSPLNDYIANSMDAIQKEIQGESYDPAVKTKVPSEFGSKLKNEIGTIAGIAQAVGGAAGLAKAGRRPDINVSKTLEKMSRDTREAAGYGLPPAVKNEMKKKNAQAFRQATNTITGAGGSAQEIHNKTISALSAMLSEQGKVEVTDFQEKERKVGVNLGVDKMKAGQEFDIDKMAQLNWKEDQTTWANLLEVGISNTIGARQYNEQLKVMKELEKSKEMSITFPK